jgi:hypothetical protein
MRAGVLNDQQNTKSLVVGLLEHIGRGLDDATNLPDAGVMGKGIILFHSVPHFTLLCLVWSGGAGEMEDAKAFKERNLATAQKYEA